MTDEATKEGSTVTVVMETGGGGLKRSCQIENVPAVSELPRLGDLVRWYRYIRIEGLRHDRD